MEDLADTVNQKFARNSQKYNFYAACRVTKEHYGAVILSDDPYFTIQAEKRACKTVKKFIHWYIRLHHILPRPKRVNSTILQ